MKIYTIISPILKGGKAMSTRGLNRYINRSWKLSGSIFLYFDVLDVRLTSQIIKM